ncbi:hypothetical protein ACF06P_35695 [Streptomyces sp. NPDC015684]|uniref:hypothetical protein n=1 Tax=Streptomyces sp. NPDC015684 TaxID=3364963 RepID=UPI0036FF4972
MTPTQIYLLGVLGGLSAVVGLLVFMGLAVALYTAVSRLINLNEARRVRRRDLAACRAIDALGTHRPKH